VREIFLKRLKMRDMHDKAGKANARHENNASKAVMGSCQMYKFGSLRQLCVKNFDN